MKIPFGFAHEFEPPVGEIWHLNGIPYAYLGEGKFGGANDPEYTRGLGPDQSGTPIPGGASLK